MDNMLLEKILSKVLSGGLIGLEDALRLSSMPQAGVSAGANSIRERFRGNTVDLCSIVNARSGACPEDCAYCAQSVKANSEVDIYPLMDEEEILKSARDAKNNGARRFCIVTSGRKPGKRDLKKIASVIEKIASSGLLPCATLGLLDKEELRMLKNSGLNRYHHNLETSERYFPQICSTHTYADKLRTIEAARDSGLSLCIGGIMGLGENWQARVEMLLSIRELGTSSVPLNFLIPRKGTALQNMPLLAPQEALHIISLARFVLPNREVRVCGGRPQVLGSRMKEIYEAGADGMLIGNYLTVTGASPAEDLQCIKSLGLRPKQRV